MILIIDGYNLLFSGLGQAADTKPNQLEVLRNNLVSTLKSYNLKKKYRIIVVFDGDKTVNHYPQERESGNVRVVFSQDKATADEHLVNLVSSYIREKPHRQDLCAVTSDRALAETLLGHRVKVISSDEFAAELTKQNAIDFPDLKGEHRSDPARGEARPEGRRDSEPMEKFTGLKPADVPKWLKIFGE
ncbi:MAG: NYN domain-containing protein [Planctomycetota bacterium]